MERKQIHAVPIQSKVLHLAISNLQLQVFLIEIASHVLGDNLYKVMASHYFRWNQIKSTDKSAAVSNRLLTIAFVLRSNVKKRTGPSRPSANSCHNSFWFLCRRMQTVEAWNAGFKAQAGFTLSHNVIWPARLHFQQRSAQCGSFVSSWEQPLSKVVVVPSCIAWSSFFSKTAFTASSYLSPNPSSADREAYAAPYEVAMSSLSYNQSGLCKQFSAASTHETALGTAPSSMAPCSAHKESCDDRCGHTTVLIFWITISWLGRNE